MNSKDNNVSNGLTTSTSKNLKKSISNKINAKWKSLPRKKKIQVATASILSTILIVGLPVFAWFSYRRETATIIPINAPTVINIKSGNAEPVEMIDLSNINVEEQTDPEDADTLITEGTYVFCVTGKYLSEYDLQISRTTNIDFDYELYRVDCNDPYSNVLSSGITSDPGAIASYEVADYKSELDDNTYYYPYKTATYSNSSDVSTYKKQGNITSLGAFLNPTTYDGQTVGNGATTDINGKSFNERNYGDEVENDGTTTIKTYPNVNVYAQPLYWQIKNLPVVGNIGDDGFIDYYVLKIKWEGKGLTNNKETDMIYITARKSIN